MIDSYKHAMDKIKADPAFKSQLLQDLESYSEERPAPKKPVRLLRILTYAASVAACLLVVYCVGIFFANPPKMTRPANLDAISDGADPSYASVIYIDFDGFEKYDINIESRAIQLTERMSETYSLTRLINENYNDVIIYDGMLYSINGVEASDELDLNIYVNDREILNLNNEFISQYFEDEDVYFTVTVTE